MQNFDYSDEDVQLTDKRHTNKSLHKQIKIISRIAEISSDGYKFRFESFTLPSSKKNNYFLV